MRLQPLVSRRMELMQRIEQQRADLATLASAFERPASYFDTGYAFAQKIKQQPKLIFGAAMLLTFIFRKRLPIVPLGAAVMKVAKWWFFLKRK